MGILTALELGVPPLQGLSGIAIINGRPSVWGDLAVALVQSKNLIDTHDVIETGTFPNDDYTVAVRFWRRGQSKPYEGKFSVADAKRAGLWAHPRDRSYKYKDLDYWQDLARTLERGVFGTEPRRLDHAAANRSGVENKGRGAS